MSSENSKKYIHLIIGYSGLLLIGLAVLRSLSVTQDTVGYALTMLGYLLLAQYFLFADTKIGATKINKAILRISLLVMLGLMAIYIY
ncbi:hypothetical protein [Alkalibacillus haloalkaliphilus]|uniref:Uncharacterized protein n=1 Tax=Alkalibacillus haloalkaliphilus TaxID=94136 RepID=A0A511W256_9BACI|nr:hypothetical protein [Alkalibacillus haloalkaliphilus]GEN44448.1 hypothetical protein AHA02nite_02240 [Alkalibacillus haloalkaliphilus]